jgi:hypothetical protein
MYKVYRRRACIYTYIYIHIYILYIIESSKQGIYLLTKKAYNRTVPTGFDDLHSGPPAWLGLERIEISITKAVFLVTSNTMTVFLNRENRAYAPGRQVYEPATC